MSVSISLGKVLSATPVKGQAALIVAFVSLAAPTLVRAVTDQAQGDGFCPYLPFVALAALALDWRAAAAVALASGLLAAYLFEGARYQLFESRCEITSFIYFCLASGLIIGIAQALRKAADDPLWLDAPAPKPTKLVFSRRAGQACVSWHGGRSFVPLGPADEVEQQMRDFLSQQELGRRLTGENAARRA
jgi:hypothetical protein